MFLNLGAVMTDPDNFPDPLRFDPERYLSEGGRKFSPHPKMITFGLGRRRCLGETLARYRI